MAPGGVAILVRALTDNRNRTVAEVRGAFTKHGGSMGEAGCVNWMFNRKGVLLIESGSVDEDQIIEMALEAGAEDVESTGGGWEVTTDPESFEAVRETLDQGAVSITSAEIAMLPENTVRVAGGDASKLVGLLDALEDSDDVQSVSANADFDEEALAQLGG